MSVCSTVRQTSPRPSSSLNSTNSRIMSVENKQLGNVHSNIYPTRCNVTQFIYIWKLLYMFWVVPPPIIRSTYNCIYSIWYLSHCYCKLLLSWKSSNSSTIAAGRSNGVTNTRCCRYSCMCSWWWVEVPPETCRAVSRYKLCNAASCWICTGIHLRCTDP
jgi:hypothetical protein